MSSDLQLQLCLHLQSTPSSPSHIQNRLPSACRHLICRLVLSSKPVCLLMLCCCATYSDGEVVCAVEDEVTSVVTVSDGAEAEAESVVVAEAVAVSVTVAAVVDGVSSFPPE